MKNYGFNAIQESLDRDGKEWQFGSASQPCIALIPKAERRAYLPLTEMQDAAGGRMNCASHSPNNLLAAKFTYAYQKNIFTPENKKWLEDNGYVKDNRVDFNNRFLAIMSGTTSLGNSLKSPLQAIRDFGLIPKGMLEEYPQVPFNIYYDRKCITEEMKTLGKEFSFRFIINYEQVPRGIFKSLDDFIDIGLYAWPNPINGIYPRIEGGYNHASLIIEPEYFDFDSYPDTFDGDYIKNLAPDYDFYETGYRVFISKQTTKEEQDILRQTSTALGKFNLLVSNLWTTFLQFFLKVPDNFVEQEIIPPSVPIETTTDSTEQNLLSDFCAAIANYEGGPNDLNHRTNNPGNIRGMDGKFLTFKTWSEGFKYLEDYVARAATGNHKAYPKNCTIQQFFNVYSPTKDSNDPIKYAKYICQKVSKQPTDLLFSILEV